MLDGFRKHSNSIVVKTLFILLIASFGAWGIGDMLRPAVTGSSVASVASVEISSQEVFNDFQREMARMRQLTGDQGINDQLSLAIGTSVVDRAVNRTLLGVGAQDMDVAISDKLVTDSIRNNEMFQEEGKFSRARFEQIMFSNKLSEGEFIKLVRGDLARDQLISLLGNGAVLPKSVAKDVYKFRQEKRSADVVVIDKDAITDLPSPTDEDVHKYYDENLAQFMAPEYRTLSLLHFTAQEIAKTIDVPAEKIEDAYTERQAEFKKAGHRTVEQMVFTSNEEATAALNELSNGTTFEDVAKSKGVDSVSLGDLTKEELPEELRDAVFDMGVKGVVGPIETALGWHVVNVSKITDEVVSTFDDVKDKLKNDIALEMAGEEVFALSNSIEDALGGGATLEEAAVKAGHKLDVIASVDQNGLDQEGKPVITLTEQQSILSDAFAKDMQADVAMKEDGHGGYYAVRVDGIVESKARPFDSVKPAVSAFVSDLQKFEAAKKQALDIVAKVKEGKLLSMVADEEQRTMTTQENISRFDTTLPKDVLADLFTGKVGDVSSGITKDGFVVASLKEIKPIEGSADDAGIEALQTEMANGVSADLQSQFINALRKSYKVSVNNAMMNRIFVTDRQ